MKQLLFPYSQKELDTLSKQDPKLGAIISRVGKIEREISPNIFEALISSIIAQQISAKAAQTVEMRLRNLVNNNITPDALANLPVESIQACGLNTKKSKYIQDAAIAACNKTIKFDNLQNLSDEEIIQQLTSLSGVGQWTAEMLLIFSLSRINVISYNDFGIRKGIELLYGIEKLTKKDFKRIVQSYQPYATIASFYLWHIANNNLKI